jgi:hypothetical protein
LPLSPGLGGWGGPALWPGFSAPGFGLPPVGFFFGVPVVAAGVPPRLKAVCPCWALSRAPGAGFSFSGSGLGRPFGWPDPWAALACWRRWCYLSGWGGGGHWLPRLAICAAGDGAPYNDGGRRWPCILAAVFIEWPSSLFTYV